MSLLPNPFYFLINITALTQFGLIPYSECSQKHVRKLVRVLEFDLCLSCCVTSSKICTFFLFFPPLLFVFFCVSLSEGQVGSVLHLIAFNVSWMRALGFEFWHLKGSQGMPYFYFLNMIKKQAFAGFSVSSFTYLRESANL